MAPVPTNPASWLTDDDYPAEALRNQWSGQVGLDIAIDAKGRPFGCRVTQTSGHAVLDAPLCAMLVKRMRFRPARDEAGRAIAAGFPFRFTWSLPGVAAAPSAPPPPDLTVDVATLPVPPDKATIPVRIVQRVDGTMESCAVVAPGASAALDRVACEMAAQLAGIDAVAGPDGEPVRALRVRRIAFVAAR